MSSFQPYPVINYNSLTDKKLGVSDPSVLIINVNDYFILLTLLNICADINNEKKVFCQSNIVKQILTASVCIKFHLDK